MTNNFKKIGDYIDSFRENKDIFFRISIIYRGKDGHTAGRENVIYDTYVASSRELYNQEDTITKICDALRARAYISLVPSSVNKFASFILDDIKHRYNSKSFRGWKECINKAITLAHDKEDSLFLVDVDSHQLNYTDDIREFLKEDIVIELPSKTGLHFLCKKIDIREFRSRFPLITVKANGMTILYTF